MNEQHSIDKDLIKKTSTKSHYKILSIHEGLKDARQKKA